MLIFALCVYSSRFSRSNDMRPSLSAPCLYDSPGDGFVLLLFLTRVRVCMSVGDSNGRRHSLACCLYSVVLGLADHKFSTVAHPPTLQESQFSKPWVKPSYAKTPGHLKQTVCPTSANKEGDVAKVRPSYICTYIGTCPGSRFPSGTTHAEINHTFEKHYPRSC